MNPLFTVNEHKNRELEYLLSRGLAPERDLAQALIESEWPRLYWLAALLTGSPAEARRISLGAVAAVLPSRRSYRADVPLSAWLDRAVLRAGPKRPAAAGGAAPDFPKTAEPPSAADQAVWQAFDRLGAARLAVLLRLLLGLSPAELAVRLEEKQTALQPRLDASLERLYAELQESPDVDTSYSAVPLAETVAESLARRWPRLPGEFDPAVLAAELVSPGKQAAPGRQWGLTRGAFWYMLAAVLAAVGLLGFGDRVFSTATDPTAVPAATATEDRPRRRTPRAPNPTRTVAPPEPLTLDSTPLQVRHRILNSQSAWETFWGDALVIQYGPRGYIGPPAVYRSQVWIEQPDRALTLAGPRSGQADSVWSLFGGSSFGVDLRSGMAYYERNQLPPESSPLLPFVPVTGPSSQEGKSLAGFYLADLLFPGLDSLPEGDFRVDGLDRVAGRDTLVVDWTPSPGLNPARLWVDTFTGTVLRWRSFSADTPELVLQDVILTGAEFDFAFPAGFFDPRSLRSGSLAWGAMWRPGSPELEDRTNWGVPPTRERLRRARAPRDFDPARETLTLQWPLRANRETLSTTDAELFAGGFYIGEVNLDDPWKLQCQRSPDGQLIAFVPDSLPALDPAFRLSWFRVNEVGQVQPVLTGDQTSADFAFSPDSRQLAFHGCTENGECAVYLMNTRTGKNASLLAVENAGWLAWSPDGSELAFVGFGASSYSGREWRLFVVDTATGAVTYSAPMRLDPGEVPADAPVRSWATTYPPSQPGLEGCLAPPLIPDQGG